MKEIINQTHLSNLQTSMIQNKKQSSIQRKYKQDLYLSRTASFNKNPNIHKRNINHWYSRPTKVTWMM
uniref:Uncharacterized protein n=1 Tax=Medicago truncatula TaxID=3880 RepID=I3T1Q5_MEDTR|nr:unknown [Medicago truncatula]